MEEKITIVVTSIAGQTEGLKLLAKGASERDYDFIVIGDKDSPTNFQIDACDFYDLDKQLETGLKFAKKCPARHYCRKNIGYLLALQKGASIIIETDDDNIPLNQFWEQRSRKREVAVIEDSGWVNIYRYFTDEHIWPRGFPLEQLQRERPALESLPPVEADCPIQQGLANDNPDVDAVYRLTLPLPQRFDANMQIAIGKGTICPFNSQNTTWWRETFQLLYLPATCSFRMTDIWRSFIAQRIAHINGWSVLYTSPTVRQKRNEHNLLRDFSDEIPGYLHNREICEQLKELPLEPGVDKITDNLRVCYEQFVKMSLVEPEELDLLDTWLRDFEIISK